MVAPQSVDLWKDGVRLETIAQHRTSRGLRRRRSVRLSDLMNFNHFG